MHSLPRALPVPRVLCSLRASSFPFLLPFFLLPLLAPCSLLPAPFLVLPTPSFCSLLPSYYRLPPSFPPSLVPSILRRRCRVRRRTASVPRRPSASRTRCSPRRCDPPFFHLSHPFPPFSPLSTRVTCALPLAAWPLSAFSPFSPLSHPFPPFSPLAAWPQEGARGGAQGRAAQPRVRHRP